VTEAEKQELIADIPRLVRGATDRALSASDPARECGNRDFLERVEREMVALFIEILDTHARLPFQATQRSAWMS